MMARGPQGLRPALGPCQVQGAGRGLSPLCPLSSWIPSLSASVASMSSQGHWERRPLLSQVGSSCSPPWEEGLGSCQESPGPAQVGGGCPWGGSPTLPPVPGSLPGVPLPLCEALGRAVVGQAQAVVPWCPGRMPGPAPPAQLLARCTLRCGQCWASSQSVFSSSKKDLGVGDGHQDLETSSVDLWSGPSLLVLNNGPKSGIEPGAKEK